MADQPVTGLPTKTASGVASTDKMLGIDSAEGYQILVRDVAKYIIENCDVSTLAGAVRTPKAAIDLLNSKTDTVLNCTYENVNFTVTITSFGNGVKRAVVSSSSGVTFPATTGWVSVADTTLNLGTFSLITVAGDVMGFRTNSGKLQIQLASNVNNHWLAGSAICSS